VSEKRLLVFRVDTDQPEHLLESLLQILPAIGMRSGSLRHTPLQNTLIHIGKLGVQCVLLQTNVQDPDFIAEHSAYYSKWSLKVPRYCHRLHFFTEPPESDEPLKVVDQMASVQDSYIGFVTIRPISVCPEGATILKPLQQKEAHFILSKDKFIVHIAGQEFSVNGTPFLQQDNAVGACAQASIWMALRTLRRKEGQSAFSPAQITSAATRFLVRGRTLPNRGGLIIEQVTEAIRAAGYSPHMIPLRRMDSEANKQTLAEAKKSLYTYVESGIPMLIMLFPKNGEGHAVLLIGHGWDANPQELLENTKIENDNGHWRMSIYDASSWVEPFYIHNDNSGPYLPLPEDGESYTLKDAVSAIPFLHPDVFIDGVEAKVTCHKLLNGILNNLHSEPNDNGVVEKNFVTRTYLQERSDFRAAVLNSSMPETIKSYYRLKWLPKRIWVMEINLLDGYERSPEGATTRVGEILLDPASEPEDGCFLTIHLGSDILFWDNGDSGVLIDRDAFVGEITGSPVEDSRPYSPLVRHEK